MDALERDGFYRFDASWGFRKLLDETAAGREIDGKLAKQTGDPKLGGNAALPAGSLDGPLIRPFTDALADILRPVAESYVSGDAAIAGVHAYRLPSKAIPVKLYGAGAPPRGLFFAGSRRWIFRRRGRGGAAAVDIPL